MTDASAVAVRYERLAMRDRSGVLMRAEFRRHWSKIISPLQETTLTTEYRLAERPDTCGSRTPIPAALSWLRNPGSHGFSEMRYEFSSAAANNGSGVEGLAEPFIGHQADRHTARHDRPCVEMEHRSAFCG